MATSSPASRNMAVSPVGRNPPCENPIRPPKLRKAPIQRLVSNEKRIEDAGLNVRHETQDQHQTLCGPHFKLPNDGSIWCVVGRQRWRRDIGNRIAGVFSAGVQLQPKFQDLAEPGDFVPDHSRIGREHYRIHEITI